MRTPEDVTMYLRFLSGRGPRACVQFADGATAHMPITDYVRRDNNFPDVWSAAHEAATRMVKIRKHVDYIHRQNKRWPS